MVCGMMLKSISKYLIFFSFLLFSITTGCNKKEDLIHLKFCTWGSETEINILKPIIENFNKENPDISVEIMHIPQNYFQKLHMLVAANLTPDVIFINNMNLPVYASGDILLNLDKKLNESYVLKEEEFFSQSLDTMSYKGKLLAIPRDISNAVIYYNKDLYDKYNISYPDKNWTFEDFLNKARKLTHDTNNDNKIDLFGTSFESFFIYYLPFAWSNGGNLFNENCTSFTLNEKSACKGLQFYSDLRNKYHVAPSAAEAGNNTMAQLFMQQRVAMFISGRWSIPRFRSDIKFRWDIARFPAGTKGSIVGIDGSGWAISKNCTHPDAAWKLIEYLASEQSITKFTETGLIVPARRDVAFSKTFLNDDLPPENADIFLEIIENGITNPQIERWNEVIDLINVTLEPVWNGNKEACQALETIHDDVKNLLE